ncbi:hypothetical protein E5206_12755 [Arthrobacter sp. PAMC25564]|nr:hypothetical protein E5206_12755 [Arthrobacter sp. PAMC25564]
MVEAGLATQFSYTVNAKRMLELYLNYAQFGSRLYGASVEHVGVPVGAADGGVAPAGPCPPRPRRRYRPEWECSP